MAMPFSLLREVSVICSSLRRHHRVFEKQLVEIAQAKEQQRVGMVFLDRGVLPHQRSGRLAHRSKSARIIPVALSHRFA